MVVVVGKRTRFQKYRTHQCSVFLTNASLPVKTLVLTPACLTLFVFPMSGGALLVFCGVCNVFWCVLGLVLLCFAVSGVVGCVLCLCSVCDVRFVCVACGAVGFLFGVWCCGSGVL